MRELVGFVYLWEHRITGKRYIGAHVGQLDDGYIGSGRAWLNAVRKHGIEAFERTILHHEYEDEALLWAAEERAIDEHGAVKSRRYYNQRGGGQRGTHGPETIEVLRARAIERHASMTDEDRASWQASASAANLVRWGAATPDERAAHAAKISATKRRIFDEATPEDLQRLIGPSHSEEAQAKRSTSGAAAWAALSPEERAARIERAGSAAAAQARSDAGRAERSARVRAEWAALTDEQRRARVEKARRAKAERFRARQTSPAV